VHLTSSCSLARWPTATSGSVDSIHVRDDQAWPTQDLDRYGALIDQLTRRCDVVTNLTTALG
jgi:uncharacterized protein (DUF849 family)